MDLLSAALSNPHNRKILERLPFLELKDCWLVAGCLFQSLWNRMTDQPAQSHIKDYDIFYFDDNDLSYEAEDNVIRQANKLFSDLDILVEVKNQARVHLWYKKKFGQDYPRLNGSKDGISRFLVAGTCLALKPLDGSSLELYAPYGTEDAEKGLLRPNPLAPGQKLFLEKAESYRKRWPWLRTVLEPAPLPTKSS